jgi:hypothetical protein
MKWGKCNVAGERKRSEKKQRKTNPQMTLRNADLKTKAQRVEAVNVLGTELFLAKRAISSLNLGT